MVCGRPRQSRGNRVVRRGAKSYWSACCQFRGEYGSIQWQRTSFTGHLTQDMEEGKLGGQVWLEVGDVAVAMLHSFEKVSVAPKIEDTQKDAHKCS